METTDEQERWIEALYDAFDNPGSGPLEVAEEALRACPGDSIMLSLASTAALLEERPDRCLIFLKRLSKGTCPTSPIICSAPSPWRRKDGSLPRPRFSNATG
jgi:hypothetical protein